MQDRIYLLADFVGVERALARVEQEVARVRKAIDGQTFRAPACSHMVVDRDGQPITSASLAEPLIGTRVVDADDSGIVIAVHAGISGNLVVYVNAAGEVNSQYESALKKQPRSASSDARKLGGKSTKTKAKAAG